MRQSLFSISCLLLLRIPGKTWRRFNSGLHRQRQKQIHAYNGRESGTHNEGFSYWLCHHNGE